MIDLDPEAFRRLGHQTIDRIADWLAAVPDMPARRPVPADVRDALIHDRLPRAAGDPETLLQRAIDLIQTYPMGNTSPRFFAWVNSPPAPLAALADALASSIGASVAGGDHAAVYIEHGVLNWLKTIMRFPPDSGALLTSGGSVANLIPLAVMRHVKSEGSIRAGGLWGERAPMVVYMSTQGHSCIQKAVEMLGIGGDYLRRIPVDDGFRMIPAALETQIAEDRAAGLRPVCVVANAGTVNTGAIDPLNALADICAREGLWFHVDGAYGGFGILAEQTEGLYDGIERADSLAVDPHKWLYVPVDCGCALVRDAEAMRDTFSVVPPYLRDDRALPWFAEFGIEQTRPFRALKLWLVLQQVGENGYRALISRDIALARSLQDRIRARPDFELVAAGPLSVTCFRYAPPGTDAIDDLNRRLVPFVQQEGRVFLTTTELDGRPALRACIVNYRTQEADLDVLLDAVAAAGERVRQET